MTRDKDRIPEVLDELEEYWNEHPDLRLGQIISNFSRRSDYGSDPFYMEDEDLLGELREINKDNES